MKIDVENYLGAVVRIVDSQERDGRLAHVVRLTRTYDTSVEDLWDAVTNSERLSRWFSPVSGELRLGGRYHLEGNASGEILVCDAPTRLALTWEFGGDVSWVDVHVSEDPQGGARLVLEHVAHVDDHWDQFGPGAAGVGWDLGLVGLGMHIQTGGVMSLDEGLTWSASEDGKTFIRGSSNGWRRASIAAGTDQRAATAAAERTTAFYTGEATADG